MKKIEMRSVQYADLSDIHDVEPLQDRDYEALRDLRAVLVRHGLTDRFGICLIHKHFEVSNDEWAVETTDPSRRVSTISVCRREESSREALIPTMWKFTASANEDVRAGTVCTVVCEYAGGHRRVHRRHSV